MTALKVNLFIVGAAKCGTTFLAEYLSQHSAINISAIKEPNYFSHEVLETKVQYYHTADVKEAEAYQSLFDHTKPYDYYGEASVSYLPYSMVAQNIHNYNPEARIIILLRNPVDRAFSHYKMDKRLGFVKESFTDIVNKTSSSPFASQYYHQYVELGFYHQQVAEYLKVFGADQVCVIQDTSAMEAVIPEVMQFLNLPIEHIEQQRVNEAISFKNPWLRKIYTVPWLRKSLKAIVPPSLLRTIKKDEEKPDRSIKEHLTALYHEDQQKTKHLLRNE